MKEQTWKNKAWDKLSSGQWYIFKQLW